MTIPPSFGDVTAEYQALTEDSALVEGGHDLVWVEGPDAVSFLDGLVSQDVAGMEPGAVARSFLLGPQGKLRALLWVIRDEDRVGLATDAGRGDVVAEDLARYRIRVKAVIGLAAQPRFELWGPQMPVLSVPIPEPGRWQAAGGVVAASLPLRGLQRVLMIGELDRPGLAAAGAVATTAVRVEAGEPVMGRDVDESTIPQETGLVGEAVSFTKGCYLGQELVARIDSRGHVNRHLRGIVITRNLIPPEGAELFFEDQPVGRLTSVSESLRVGAPVGLGLIRREAQPGDDVEARWGGGSVPALVRELPLV